MLEAVQRCYVPDGEPAAELERLHLKQAEIAKRSGKSVPQMNMAEDMERRRK